MLLQIIDRNIRLLQKFKKQKMKIGRSPSSRDNRFFMHKMSNFNKENQRNSENQAIFKTNHLEIRKEAIEWIYRAQQRLRLSTSTQFLSIGVIDQLLLKNVYIFKENQQIYTAVVLWICAKFNEVYPPSITKLNFLCVDKYSKLEFQQIQAKILQKLDFNIQPDQIYAYLAEFQTKYQDKKQLVKQTVKIALMYPNQILKYGRNNFIQGLKSYMNGGVFERCNNKMENTTQVFEIRKQLTRLRSANHKRLGSLAKY